ncbi:predicted protein [Postia placenta Mad-698-R]|uniref:Uncharacterized protein n=1 Tax=Postia placenta MAD-698-R-SB12 TaxID=670580 RepID=A0A1X6NGA3_9APHY|nr:hypothetical protein POSPLADRAFT_1051797 [Postia placenta MAD-698-R-SB12]EED78428.1 predicted protein [Postia placenta Mad-698-R]OSX67671.1 hypothetical protein POSPLADRAFT_1051797 [Postia placenta MAD-698-R-SB12]
MATSEIDDIFASKGKAATKPVASSSSLPPADKVKKKKKGTKRDSNSALGAEDNAHRVQTVKRPVPETVLDPSARLPAAAPKKSKATKSSDALSGSTKKRKVDEDEEWFRDSRGTGPRRKTEEGWAVYKEDELGITDQGGGQHTPHLILAVILTSHLRHATMSL